jgi:integrase
MVILAVTTGLGRSELFAFKWRDIDFSNFLLDVQRSIYLGTIGHCETEASRKPVPLDERVAADLWLWKETSKYGKMDDWIFASPHRNGRLPFWPDAILQRSFDQLPEGLKFGKQSDGIRFDIPTPRF